MTSFVHDCPHVPVSTFRSLFSAAASPLAHHGAGQRLLLRAPNHSTSPPHPPHGTARFLFRLTDIISRCAQSKLQRRWSPFSPPTLRLAVQTFSLNHSLVEVNQAIK